MKVYSIQYITLMYCRVHLISAEATVFSGSPKWIADDWKNVTSSDESQILLGHADGSVIIRAA